MTKYMIVFAAVLGLAACKKKAPEQIPQPKAEETAAVSTAAVVEQNPLKMPAAYIKGQVGNIEKAKAAKAIYEKAAQENMAGQDLGGGN